MHTSKTTRDLDSTLCIFVKIIENPTQHIHVLISVAFGCYLL